MTFAALALAVFGPIECPPFTIIPDRGDSETGLLTQFLAVVMADFCYIIVHYSKFIGSFLVVKQGHDATGFEI